MSMDRISGKAKEWVGKGEEAVGEALEDGRVRARGAARQVEGKVQGAIGCLTDSIDDVADTVQTLVRRHPVASIAVVGGLAYLLGRIAGAIGRRS